MPPTLKYTTTVLGPFTPTHATTIFHDHAFFLSVDPNLLSYEADIPPQGGALHPLPADITPLAPTRCYEVTDRMPPGVALFAKLLPGSGTTKVYYEITDIADGIFIFMRAPMGVTEERRWVAEEGEGGVRIVEWVEISCSRLLYGSVKGQQDQNWKECHAKYVKKIGGEIGPQSTSTS